MIEPGQNVDGYEILSSLGKGGMAEVYKAKDLSDGKIVAIKFISIELGGTPQLLKRFELEYQTLIKLKHDHIVEFLKFGNFENMPYFVMEYLPGGTLKDHIGDPLSVQKAASLLSPIARALEKRTRRRSSIAM